MAEYQTEYRVRKVCIKSDHVLYQWAETLTARANNLYNAALFRLRQVLTASKKAETDWTEHERDVMEEVQLFVENSEGKFKMPKKGKLSYTFLVGLMGYTKNPDYLAEGLPRQSAQQTIRQTVNDLTDIFKSIKAYYKDPSRFTGKPKLTGYKRKGGHATAYVTNQDCVIHTDEQGNWSAKLPLMEKGFRLELGERVKDCAFKELVIKPENGAYQLCFVFEYAREMPDCREKPERICAVDLGVDNLMAVTNNCGLPCLLYQGKILKSINQLYNKKLAAIMAEEMSKPDCPVNKKGKPRFVPTKESQRITRKRNDQIHDFMHKAAKHLIAWCVENRIDTIVVGVNADWKQDVELGAVNNQNFVQIPHAVLRQILKYLCHWNGINYVEREESYTSRASFPDQDYIPTYGVDDEKANFSGRRRPTRYKGMYKKDGFRGLYQTADGTIINADLNGSANILRKEYPDAFKTMPDFANVCIIRNPEEKFVLANQRKQLEENGAHYVISHSKAKRLKRKLAS